MNPGQPVLLRELLDAVLTKEVDKLLAALPQPDDMGFEVYRWR